jgi:outer membrane protein OmpA-like peptidoglycan-associated protein
MRTRIIALVTASLIANAGLAAEKPKRGGGGEGPGVAIGTIAGAVLGGPVGFMVGGGLGGWLGNKFDRERDTADEYQARYRESEELAGSLEQLLAVNEAELDQMRDVMREREVDYRDTLSEALGIEVYFRTGEATLDTQVADRIDRLGRLMREFGDFTIIVEGHADPRGEAGYNDELSAARAAAVRDTLIAAGLPASQIALRASGERGAESTEGDLDAMALERRVDLRIVQPLSRENRVARQ